MKVIFEKIEEISDREVEYYSVRLGEKPITEFELFDAKDFPRHDEELQIIYNVIDQMRWRGARQFFFKQEGPANALPRVNQEIIDANNEDFGLRLYCIRLTDNLVVLLNGEIKTKINPIDCPNVRIHFRNALKIAQKLDKALFDKEVNYQETDCLLEFEIEI